MSFPQPPKPPSPEPPSPKLTPKKPQGWQLLNQGAPIAVLLAAGLIVLYRLVPVLELIAIAILLSVIFKTLLQWLRRLVKLRWLALLLLVSLVVSFIALFVFVVVPNLISEFTTLLSVLPDYANTLSERGQALENKFGLTLDISGSVGRLTSFIYGWIGNIPALLSQITSLTVDAVATLILAIYIAQDPGFLLNGIYRITPSAHRPKVKRILQNSRVKLQGWLFGTLIAMLFLGAGATLGLWIIGIPLALSFGVIAGLFEIIPYFGSIVGTFLPALVALTLSPVKLLLVLALFLVLNQVDAHIVQPIIVGSRVHLKPAAVIIAFLIMGELLGLIGVLVAVPTAAVILALFEEL